MTEAVAFPQAPKPQHSEAPFEVRVPLFSPDEERQVPVSLCSRSRPTQRGARLSVFLGLGSMVWTMSDTCAALLTTISSFSRNGAGVVLFVGVGFLLKPQAL